ncbi:E3 ubiquitin-protein ligase TRIM38-like [Sorex araneus]|uniref:E3 ubiquitin-protein ligase TRIM38-like n=1 Tax=Sorex araneus TaxID=42254 RepID=UPI002433FC49|nr:E3 ubiquitin-protein ligase TRIM38-like [Sorex araneus]
MASDSAAKKLREEATCSTCLRLMTEPVSINCGHSFCHKCIVGLIENQQRDTASLGTFLCALCGKSFERESLRPNKKLQSLIEVIKEMDREVLCEEHGEQLHLFCEDDGQLICWCCERSPQHKGHVAVLAEDICQGYKEKLEEAVTKLREHEHQCNNLKLLIKKQRTEWEEKVQRQQQTIQSNFENLHNFLYKEEEYYLWRLEEEKEQTLRRLQESEDELEKQRQKLKNHILELERKRQASTQTLLQEVKVTLSRSSEVRLEFPEAVALDLRTVCNVSELYFDVRKVLKRYQVSVTLDPETAHSDLSVSEEGRTVVAGGRPQKKPLSASRFTALPCVLGREGFTSGRRYFEVHVGGEGQLCDLGVCLSSVQRDISVKLQPECGFWALRLCSDRGLVALTWPRTPLLQDHLSLVGVFVDYEAGLVSFYNMETGSHIFTFPEASFSHTLLPFFRVCPSSPLTLLTPGKAMASGTGAKKLREESTCSICLELMTEPVSIDCGHSFCRVCLVDLIENQSFVTLIHCPLCQVPFRRESIRPNKHLKSLIETIKEIECERVCEEHRERLLLFCEDDDQLICWRCERSPPHKGHIMALLEDVSQGYKEKLQEAVKTLQKLKIQCETQKVFTEKQITEWEEKVELQRQTIQLDFDNLHAFLFEEAKYYFWKLQKEKEDTLSSLQQSKDKLEKQSQELGNCILELEKKCQGSAQDLLQDVRATLSRSLTMKLELPEPVSLDVHTVCNVSELYFDVKKMSQSYLGM